MKPLAPSLIALFFATLSSGCSTRAPSRVDPPAKERDTERSTRKAPSAQGEGDDASQRQVMELIRTTGPPEEITPHAPADFDARDPAEWFGRFGTSLNLLKEAACHVPEGTPAKRRERCLELARREFAAFFAVPSSALSASTCEGPRLAVERLSELVSRADFSARTHPEASRALTEMSVHLSVCEARFEALKGQLPARTERLVVPLAFGKPCALAPFDDASFEALRDAGVHVIINFEPIVSPLYDVDSTTPTTLKSCERWGRSDGVAEVAYLRQDTPIAEFDSALMISTYSGRGRCFMLERCPESEQSSGAFYDEHGGLVHYEGFHAVSP